MQDSARKFKEEVAEAAISLFKRNGYNNVTVNEICKECGISRSVLLLVQRQAQHSGIHGGKTAAQR